MMKKKHWIFYAVVAVLAIGAVSAVIGTALFFSAGPRSKDTAGEKPWYELGMTSDEVLDQVLLFYLSEAWQGMSDINECLETLDRVDADDPESWSREWRKTAERLERTGYEKLEEGHRFSAGEYLMRASTYYRASMHRNMHPGSDEVKEMTELEITCFVKSQELLETPMEVVAVPFEGIDLTGYYFMTDGDECDDQVPVAPVLIVHQGRDAWAEDCRYLALEAARRGYHCLLIDGPGNGQTLRRHDLPFRPDWESFVGPVVDYLLERPEVDPEGVMLMGISMGGYLAGRAAAFEPRLRICIANPGVLDWGETFFTTLEEYSP
ncbi:MAG: alpha/beta fold hydrolase, partial [Spirochaetota bacterium]|nr:alpha/beta fold hydrolase [Spirochaetota bacterium]